MDGICSRGSGSGYVRSFVTDFGMRLTGSQVSIGTYTNQATSDMGTLCT